LPLIDIRLEILSVTFELEALLGNLMNGNQVGNFRLPKQGLVSRMRPDLMLLVVQRTEFLEMLSATRSVF
jgi:hypothetical protein